jgi:hypothetical protein
MNGAAGGEGGLDDAHDPTTQLEGKQVGDDGKDSRADHAGENTGDHSGEQQEAITVRDPAQQRACDKAAIEQEQELLAVVPIGKTCCQKAGYSGAKRVHRYDQAKLRRRDP